MALEISEQSKDEIISWQRLRDYKGFRLLIRHLDEKIAEAEKIIFTLGADHKQEFTARDVAIIKRDNAIELKELPDMMIKALSGTGQSAPENPDAYADEDDNFSDMLGDDDI